MCQTDCERVTVGSDCMDWLDLTEDRDMFGAVLNAVMNLRLHKTREFLA